MFKLKSAEILDLHMQRPGEEASRAGDDDPPILLDKIDQFSQHVNNNEPLSPDNQEASEKPSSGGNPNIPHSFSPQSYLENEDGGHGMYRHIIGSLSRSSPDGQPNGKAFSAVL